MKKLLLPILFLLLVLPAIAQNYVQISGTVTDLANGNPIANQAVTISNDSAGGWFYYQTVYTNNSGLYIDTIPVPLNTQGILYVRTVDCQNFQHQTVITFMPALLVFTADFNICYNSSPCAAGFSSAQSQPLTVQFTDASVGGGNLRMWEFGDGTSSSDLNPVHQYAQPGYYNVSLTIGALGTPCYNTFMQSVYVWDSTASGCQASFYAVPDTMNTLGTFHFFDTSAGNIISWNWDFGDGGTSSLQNPVHTFALNGTYSVCLTIHGVDSSCYDVSCQTVTTISPSSCQAAFVISSDSTNSNSRYFWDQSTGINIQTWTWNFGDGQTQVITAPGNPNVSHTYAQPGIYSACLTIQSNDSTCYDYICQTFVIGSSGCQAAFTYYTDSTNTSNTVHFVDLSAGNSLTWNWSFGDGTASYLQNPVHTYSAPGYYLVQLMINSQNPSCTSTIWDTIYVGANPGCQANFTYNVTPAAGSHAVYFTDLSTGSPTAWQWSFGDGTASNLQNPVHTYAGPGIFNVCLTISGNNCTSTFCQNVVIDDSVNYHQIYGQVFAGNFPLNLGMAMIFSVDTTGNYTPYVATAPIDSNGIYYFTLVPDGNYYVLVVPIDPTGYLPTYYGNSISWEQATQITLGTENNPYNINLVESDQMTPGPGSANGQINMGDVSNAMADKINMIIMNAQGKAIGYTNVSESGAFSFPSLAYGTYYLHAEMPGVTSDMVMITLTAEIPHTDIVMTFSGNRITGMQDETTLANEWSVYPNPVVDNLRMSIDMKRGTRAEVSVYSVSGQLMVKSMMELQSGSNTLTIPTASLPAGAYTLRLFSKEGLNIHAKIIKTR